MRVNCNISALTANNQLSKAQTALDKSIERLSSGLKINHAEDDAAGMAISKKMHTQVKALERATSNASDGIYVAQTAEGALGEMENVLQRMRELAVQGASESYSDEDRAAIQQEINELSAEVDRISTDTEYNTMPLLDGTVSRRGYADVDDVNLLDSTSNVASGDYTFSVTSEAKQANMSIATFAGTVSEDQAGTMKINGAAVSVEAGDTYDDIKEKLIEACNTAGLNLEDDGSISTTNYGSDESITVTFDNDELAALFGMGTENTAYGEDCEVELGDGFPESAVAVTDGTIVTVKSTGNFEMRFEVPGDTTFSDCTMKVTDMGVLNIQVGANEGQTIDIDIPTVNMHTLGLDNLNVGTGVNSTKAIAKIDDAITYVSSIRSKLGAYQNRLETAVSSLSLYDENMTSALSGLEDCDMAAEMTTYTSQNVISQAATSVLSQANERPESVLQLLQ